MRKDFAVRRDRTRSGPDVLNGIHRDAAFADYTVILMSDIFLELRLFQSGHSGAKEIRIADISGSGGCLTCAPDNNHNVVLGADIDELAEDSDCFECALMDRVGFGPKAPPHVAVVNHVA